MTPELNDIFRSRGDVLDFVGPVNLSSVGRDRFFLSVSVVNLELVVVGDVVGSHPLLNRGSLIPARTKNFITTHMNVLVREEVLDVLEDKVVSFISLVNGRVKLVVVVFATRTSNGDVSILSASAPRSDVTRRINFRNDSDTVSSSIINNFLNIFLGISVSSTIGTKVRHFRNRFEFNGERFIISNVPVENIHFVVHHSI